MKVCLKGKKKRKLKMLHNKSKVELRYLSPKKEKIKLDTQRISIQLIPVLNQILKDGFQDGKDQSLRNTTRRKVFTQKVLKEMLK